MDRDQSLREQLAEALRAGHAHQPPSEILAALPVALQGQAPAPGLATPWQLLEHLRISQWDILEFSRNPGHVSPRWPEGYWPPETAPADAAAWDRSVAGFGGDLQALVALATDPARDLLAPFAYGDGQTLAREVILAAVHNAYHLGQLVTARRMLDSWPPATSRKPHP